ncbi:hypothetical protein K1719_037158 [Acacia pycnantha]|nr:hypothetical protein K1719_037158 [Acacia pycnantha]
MDEALGFCGEFVFFYLLGLMVENTFWDPDFFQVNYLPDLAIIYIRLGTLPAAQVGVKWKSAFLHFTDEEIDSNIVPKSIKARKLRKLLVFPGIYRTSISCSFRLSRGCRATYAFARRKAAIWGDTSNFMIKIPKLVMDDKVQKAFNGVEILYKSILDIIDARWANQLYRPLHCLRDGSHKEKKSFEAKDHE